MNLNNQKRENRLRLVEDHIGRSLVEIEKSGEMRAAPSYGKPLDFGDGYQETPEELRMGFKILKDAGFVPPAIELMREIESLAGSLGGSMSEDEAFKLQTRLSELRQTLALQMERLQS